jgi:hypothetical protein
MYKKLCIILLVVIISGCAGSGSQRLASETNASVSSKIENDVTTKSQSHQQSWRNLDAEYRQAFADKQYDKAVLKASLSVQSAKQEYGDSHFFVAISLNNLSHAYRLLGQKELSNQHFSSAIKMTQNLLNTDDPKITSCYESCYQRKSKLQESTIPISNSILYRGLDGAIPLMILHHPMIA